MWEKSKAAITDLVWPGRQAMILRCTEFGMLLEVRGSLVPLIDRLADGLQRCRLVPRVAVERCHPAFQAPRAR